jgi:hypothetical protein
MSDNNGNGHKKNGNLPAQGTFDMRQMSRHLLDGVERAMRKGIGLTDEVTPSGRGAGAPRPLP